ncbi:putative helicase with zinc finger domain [Haemaphysalis longicornis]
MEKGYQKYASDLLWRYSKAKDASAMQRIMTEELQGLKLACKQPLQCTVSSEETGLLWDFELHTTTRLQRLVLLRDAHRSHFELRCLRVGSSIHNLSEGSQEWVSKRKPPGKKFVYHIQVAFQVSSYGTFRQTLVFDFGTEPVLARQFSVDVVHPIALDKINSGRRRIRGRRGQWYSSTVDVVPFAQSRSASAQSLYDLYPAPDPQVFQLTQSVVRGVDISRENYKAQMHELLYIEEMARANAIARTYNGRATLQITADLVEDTNAQGGELFASVPLAAPVAEDTKCGRLMLRSCNFVWLSRYSDRPQALGRRKVFELPIHLIEKRCVYIRVTKECVEEFGLKPRTSFEAEVQFQLDRLPLCRMHYAVDRLPTTSLVLPEFRIRPSPCPREWEQSWDPRLSEQQQRTMEAILSPFPVVGVPPVLVEGPCGTGKTFVLAQALFEVIGRLPDSRVLVCTQSNSAADLFVLDYLAKKVADRPALRPLRLVDEFRKPDDVDHRLLPFCLEVPQDQQSKEGPWFRQPTSQELEEYRVVVTTLVASEMLIASGLNQGFFTHIFIDEAAQAMEAECILPLAMADETTRIVLAGDRKQFSPELFSSFERDRPLHASLLERISGILSQPHLPTLEHPCRITLTENFRSHEALVQFMSGAFYGGRLSAALLSQSAAPQPHPRFYPLSFVAVKGEDQDQDGTSTSFCNRKEAGHVCEFVKQLAESWPESWGPCDLATIAVVTPYYDQAQYIRTQLRDCNLSRVRVECGATVQGKVFRAVILSTVRTQATRLALERAAAEWSPEGIVVPPIDFSFLSDTEALSTALARAQSLVAVIGDPILLCSRRWVVRRSWKNHYQMEKKKNLAVTDRNWQFSPFEQVMIS